MDVRKSSLYLSFAMIFCFLEVVYAKDVILSWDPNSESDVVGYKIYYGPFSRIYGSAVDARNSTSHTITGLDDYTTYYFAVTAYDTEGLESDFSNEVNVVSADINQPPVADAGAEQTVNETAAVILDGSKSFDPNDSIVSYLWEQTAGTLVALSDAEGSKTTFVAPKLNGQKDALTFSLTVTDTFGLSNSDSTTVNVASWGNVPPAADAGSDQTVNEGDMVVLDGSGSTDPDDGIYSYQWIQTAGTSASLYDSTMSQTSFEAPAGSGGETLTFQLTVSDSCGLQSSDSCKVMVAESTTTAGTYAVYENMYVSDIAIDLIRKGPNYQARAYVTVLDVYGNPVNGGTTNAEWSLNGQRLNIASSTTNRIGQAKINSDKVKARPGDTFTVTITGVEKAGFAYQAASSIETSDSAIVY